MNSFKTIPQCLRIVAFLASAGLSQGVAYTLDDDTALLQTRSAPKILTFDGGGMRGIYSLKILDALVRQLPFSLNRYVDWYGGSSTGSFIAAGLALGVSLPKARAFYLENGPKIFTQSTWTRLTNFFKEASYDDGPLNLALQEVCGAGTCLSDVSCGLAISSLTVYDGVEATSIPHVFDSRKVRDHHLPVWELCRASASAPGIFKPYELDALTFLDGGMVANNPSLATLMQIVEPYHSDLPLKEKILTQAQVISIGTGMYEGDFAPKSAKVFGSIYWLKSLPHTIIHGSMRLVDQQMAQLMGNRYIRLNGALKEYLPLDGADPVQMAKIEKAAEVYIYSDVGAKAIHDAARLLMN